MKHCILLHLYYQDLWPEFKAATANIISDDVHLYVTITDPSTQFVDDIRKVAKEVFVVENRGFDVAPFLYAYNKVKHIGYTSYLKIHGKKSLHTPGIGDAWRQSLYKPLVDNYSEIIKQIEEIDGCWMVGGNEFYFDQYREPLNHPNRRSVGKYITRLNQILGTPVHGSFIAGTMFIVSGKYLETLFNGVDLEKLYYEFEPGYNKVSLAHGFERVIGYGIHQHGGVYYLL